MASLFGGKSQKKTIYRQLNQTFSEDEEDLTEEEVVFGEAGDLELQLVPTDPCKVKVKHERGRKEANFQSKTNYLYLCALVTLAVLSLVAMAFAVLAAKRSLHGDEVSVTPTRTPNVTQAPVTGSTYRPQHRNMTPDWTLKFQELGGESCVRLLDVDGDGLNDIIFAGAIGVLMDKVTKNMAVYNFTAMRRFCQHKGLGYPCMGVVVALRGYDGQELWRVNTRSEVFLLNCLDVDVNADGRPDCLGTGRQATAVAIDPYNGKLLWSAEDKAAMLPSSNMYQMSPLSDWDKDGIVELLLTNGGDPRYLASEHNRTAGRVLVLSGRTGAVVGGKYLELPNRRETYMTPVLYRLPVGGAYILLGTGGETVPGNLLGISEADLCRYFLGKASPEFCPQTDDVILWPQLPRDAVGLFTIYSAVKKGIMVPPVIVDMNHDNVGDILVSAYDGKLTLLDGRSLKVQWTTEFPDSESYSSPAPGYFDDDDVLDFMVHWCDGAWPGYSGSNVSVVNGKDGTILWTMRSEHFEMASDLTLKTAQSHRDLFVFRVKGRASKLHWKTDGTIEKPSEHKSNVSKRHGGDMNPHPVVPEDNESPEEAARKDFRSRHLMCDDDLASYKGEVFIMDRTIVTSPVKILDLHPENRTFVDDETNTTLCTVLIHDDRSTGALGDLDGDGHPEYIGITAVTGTKYDTDYGYAGDLYYVEIIRKSLRPLLSQPAARTEVAADISVSRQDADKDISQVTILGDHRQQWTEYMGTRNDNHYDTDIGKR